MLKDFKDMVEELQAENGSNGKKEILKRYPQCKELLRWTLDPYKKFGVTSSQLKKHKDKVLTDRIYEESNTDDMLRHMLNQLVSRDISGHTAIEIINWFIQHNKKYEDIIYRIIDKDLKCRTGATLINSVYPGLIPEFNVTLAEDHFKQKKVDLASGKWFWSRKLDGVRCICRKEDGVVTFYSRQGHEFLTLGKLEEEIKTVPGNFVLDGEICLVDEHGKENFQDVMKEIRKKDHTIKSPKYLVFDSLTLNEFDNGDRKTDLGLAYRYNRFGDLIHNTSTSVSIVEQNLIKTEKDLEDAIQLASNEGWEGLILRKDVPYEGKRTKNMLKVKKMHDAEYIVRDVLTGDIDDGQGNKVKGMTAVEICHVHSFPTDGPPPWTTPSLNKVKVGSGWTYDQRIRFKDNPEEIIGKTITVKYFEETKNQNGGYSLRFPIVKAIHGEKREV